jgi:hypothetical protein
MGTGITPLLGISGISQAWVHRRVMAPKRIHFSKESPGTGGVQLLKTEKYLENINAEGIKNIDRINQAVCPPKNSTCLVERKWAAEICF